jgi:hypothetical protein
VRRRFYRKLLLHIVNAIASRHFNVYLLYKKDHLDNASIHSLMIICSCTSKRRQCIQKSQRESIRIAAHHQGVSVRRVAAAAPLFVVAHPIVADHQYVVDRRSLAVSASDGRPLLVCAYLHLEGVGISPDIVPGLDVVVAGIASTEEYRNGEEPGHNFAELG